MASGSRFFGYKTVDASAVSEIVKRRYGLELGGCVKAFFVRVTPDPENQHARRIEDELHLIQYLHEHVLHYVCCPLQTGNGEIMVREQDMVIVTFRHAKGVPVNFIDWKWIGDEVFAKSWGRQYAIDHLDRVSQVRRWHEVHGGVMKGAPLDPRDEALIDNPKFYGIGHGDLNLSNFFWLPPGPGQEYGLLDVFDWDQVCNKHAEQSGDSYWAVADLGHIRYEADQTRDIDDWLVQVAWFTYDLAQCVYFPYMLSHAGTFIDGSIVPGKEAAAQFTTWACDGYDSAFPDGEKVDRAAVDRMVLLRREFYDRMCHECLKEIDEMTDQETLKDLAPMRAFMKWVADWLDREGAESAAS